MNFSDYRLRVSNILHMEEKMSDPDFLGDTQNLIRPDIKFNPQSGYELVRSQLIDKLQ